MFYLPCFFFGQRSQFVFFTKHLRRVIFKRSLSARPQRVCNKLRRVAHSLKLAPRLDELTSRLEQLACECQWQSVTGCQATGHCPRFAKLFFERLGSFFLIFLFFGLRAFLFFFPFISHRGNKNHTDGSFRICPLTSLRTASLPKWRGRGLPLFALRALLSRFFRDFRASRKSLCQSAMALLRRVLGWSKMINFPRARKSCQRSTIIFRRAKTDYPRPVFTASR